ncbi:hypothetical protein [Leucothrix mucor]|uniref:hypothetical protein n=1 Tax=Leucothrix mucor TaxID=45248 RepID=UPI0003B7A03D|nr:hypothetical protein [Leucothrix mucor]
MKIKLLAILDKKHEQYNIWSPVNPAFIIVSCDREEGLKRLSEFLEGYLARILGQWIKYSNSGSTGSKCNCPEGYVELPQDIWKCKLNKSICTLQSEIDLTNTQRFFSGCTAPIEKRKGILSAIESGRYSEFHHVVGRNLCVLCEGRKGKKIYYEYHYEIEMQLISEVIDISEKVLQLEIAKHNYPESIKYCKVCTECCLEFIRNIHPTEAFNFSIVELDYFGR